MANSGSPSASGVSSGQSAHLPASASSKQGRPPEIITQSNIDRIEKETIAEVSRAITVLESVLAQWDALDKKPQQYREDFIKYKRFHEELTDWETRILRSAGDDMGLDDRIKRLGEFVRICKAHT